MILIYLLLKIPSNPPAILPEGYLLPILSPSFKLSRKPYASHVANYAHESIVGLFIPFLVIRHPVIEYLHIDYLVKSVLYGDA